MQLFFQLLFLSVPFSLSYNSPLQLLLLRPFSFTATFFFLSSILFLCHLLGPAFVFSTEKRKKPPADHCSSVEWLLSLDILPHFFLCFFEAAAGIRSVALLPPSVFILPPFLYSAIPRGVDGSTLSTLFLQRFDLFLVAFSLLLIVFCFFFIIFIIIFFSVVLKFIRTHHAMWPLSSALCSWQSCSGPLNKRHAASTAHAQYGEATALWKTTTITTAGLEKEMAPWSSALLALIVTSKPSPTAAISARALYVDGAEPMNLASQSGDAGGSQLLFANFNQDNT